MDKLWRENTSRSRFTPGLAPAVASRQCFSEKQRAVVSPYRCPKIIGW